MATPPIPPAAPPPQSSWGMPQQQPTAPAPQQSRRNTWPLIIGVLVLLAAAVASTAAVTYAVTRPDQAAKISSQRTEPQYSASDQAAAKGRVCKVFDLSLRGQEGQGGLINNGELNVPVMLRRVNSVVAVNNALIPATPPETRKAAELYIDTSLDLTTAATGKVSVAEGNRLNSIANEAIFAFADLCGVPR